mgnify:FL=1
MATRIKFVCLPRKTTNICCEMISDERFHNHPKLFHIWVALHEYPQTSHGALAKKVGCSKDVIKKHLKKMKELNLIEEVRRNEYNLPTSIYGAFIDRRLNTMPDCKHSDDKMVKMAHMLWDNTDTVKEEWAEGRLFYEEQLKLQHNERLAEIPF